MDDFDRILSSEPVVRPSAAFRDRVMGAVRLEAATPPPIEFPWRRFLPGTLAGVGVMVVALVLLSRGVEAGGAVDPGELVGLLDSGLARELGVALLALAGSVMVAGLAMRAAWSKSDRF